MKGGLIDLLFFSFIVFLITILFLFFNYLWGVFSESFYNATGSNEFLQIKQNADYAFNIFGNALVIFYFFLLIAGFISAYFSNFHPVMFFVAILFFALSIIVAYTIKETFFYLVSEVQFINQILQNYPFLILLFENLTLIVSGFGLIYTIIMFIRRQEY